MHSIPENWITATCEYYKIFCTICKLLADNPDYDSFAGCISWFVIHFRFFLNIAL